jgi:hypothetical protein
MLVCAGLSLSSCAQSPPLDSYCLIYNPVVVQKGDGAITAKPAVKKRILANELNYGQCPK